MKSPGDEGGQRRTVQGFEFHQAPQLLHGGFELLLLHRQHAVKEKNRRGGNGGEVGEKPVIRLRPADDGGMIPKQDQPPIRHKGERFRSRDDFIRIRRNDPGFIQLLQPFRKQLFPEIPQRLLLQMLLGTLKEKHGRQISGGQTAGEFSMIHLPILHEIGIGNP